MIYAIQDRIKTKAKPNSTGICLGCGKEVKSYCGKIYVWHWKHVKDENCDSWTEPETQWHLNWKEKFGIEQTEIKIIKNEKWHIADIYTKRGLTIELQNSPINVEEIKKRENFYGDKMIWVLNEKRFQIRPIELNSFSYCYSQPFTIFFDIKIYGFPNWIIDFLDFEVSENLKNELKKNNFSYDNDKKIYSKFSSYRTCRRWGFEEDITNKLVRLIRIEIAKIKNENQNLFKFHLFLPNKTWSVSERNLFIDYDNEFILWLKDYRFDRYGIVKKIRKETFISKYKCL